MRVVPAVFVVGLLALSVPGCLDDQKPTVAAPPAGDLAHRLAANVPALQWDGDAGITWWENFVQTYTKRDAFTPANDAATQHIAQSVKALGLQTTVIAYPASVPMGGPPLPAAVGPLTIHVVVGYRAGTTQPDHAIAVGGHYDTQTATIQGAYDNGAGTAMVYNICKELSKVPMARTLACIFFDGEERGLVASEHYVQDVVKDNDEGYVYDLVMGYDMTGLNWPGYSAWKMYVMTGPVEDVPALVSFADGIMHSSLGYPDSGVEVLDVHDRNSDERNFKEAHVPILRFAGGRNAADYDQYHKPLDTVDHVYEVAGGRASFEKGFATIVEASYTTALAFDRTSMAELHSVYG